jgi:inosose dehydratase
MKLAAAPISWGVCEVPDWGVQLAPDVVLSEMRALGFAATEAGPPGFLPSSARQARSLLDSHRLRLVGAFVTAVLHDRSRREDELVAVARQADWLAAAGAEVLVLAAAAAHRDAGYSSADGLSGDGWRALFDGIDAVAKIAAQRGLGLAVHPHFGTMIERREQVERFLEESAHPLCLDTGHLALGGADPVKVAREAGPRVRHVHLKDLDGDLADRVRHGSLAYGDAVRQGLFRALGQGVARIAEVLQQLRAARYGGWYVLEQDVMLDHAPEPGPPAHVSRSLEYAKKHG